MPAPDKPWFKIGDRVSSATAALVALTLVGCFDGQLGNLCENEHDCAVGLRCVTANGSAGGICAVGCETTSCEEGICAQTLLGRVCLAGCSSHADCPGPSKCQKYGGTKGCWYEESHSDRTPPPGDESIPGSPYLDRVELTSDSDSDGVVEPGELIQLAIFIGNSGSTPVERVWIEVAVPEEGIENTLLLGSSDELNPVETIEPGEALKVVDIWLYLEEEIEVKTLDLVLSVYEDGAQSFQETYTLEVHQ